MLIPTLATLLLLQTQLKPKAKGSEPDLKNAVLIVTELKGTAYLKRPGASSAQTILSPRTAKPPKIWLVVRSGDAFWLGSGTMMRAIYTGDQGPSRYVTERKLSNAFVAGTRYFGNALGSAKMWEVRGRLTHAGSRPLPPVGQLVALPLVGSKVSAKDIRLYFSSPVERPFRAELSILAGQAEPVAEWRGLSGRSCRLDIPSADLTRSIAKVIRHGVRPDSVFKAKLRLEFDRGVEVIPIELLLDGTPPPNVAGESSDAALDRIYDLVSSGWWNEALLRCHEASERFEATANAYERPWGSLFEAMCGDYAVDPKWFDAVSWPTKTMGKTIEKNVAVDGGTASPHMSEAERLIR